MCLLDLAGGRYWTISDLCDELVEAQQGRLYTEAAPGCDGSKVYPPLFWKRYAALPLVILDEFGSRDKVTDHHYETSKRGIDYRQGKPLVCISNLPLERLESIYDDRVASRLASGTIVELGGLDRRLNGES